MKGAEHSNEYANSIALCRCRKVMPISNLLNKTLCRSYSSKYSNSIIYFLNLVCLSSDGSDYQCSDYMRWLMDSFSQSSLALLPGYTGPNLLWIKVEWDREINIDQNFIFAWGKKKKVTCRRIVTKEISNTTFTMAGARKNWKRSGELLIRIVGSPCSLASVVYINNSRSFEWLLLLSWHSPNT